MGKLKEYAWVAVAIVTVMTSLGSLGLWGIRVQIIPEIRRVDVRIDSLADRVDRMDQRFEARFDRITDRVDRMDKRFEARFDRIEVRIDRIESDIKTILLRLPKPQEKG